MLLTRKKWLRQAAAVAETGNLLFLKLLWRKPAAAASYPSTVYRSYLALAGEDRWRCCSVFEYLADTKSVRAQIEHIPSDVIATPLEQLSCLALLVASLSPENLFEIGTFRGRTALNFALNAPPEARVHTLDLPPVDTTRGEARGRTNAADSHIISNSETGLDYQGSDVEHKIEQLYGDSQNFDFSPYAGKMDFVYVDGAHDYASARSDSENAIRMLRPGGTVAWDEFCNYGEYNDVTRAVLDTVSAENVVHIANTQLALYRKPLP